MLVISKTKSVMSLSQAEPVFSISNIVSTDDKKWPKINYIFFLNSENLMFNISELSVLECL